MDLNALADAAFTAADNHAAKEANRAIAARMLAGVQSASVTAPDFSAAQIASYANLRRGKVYVHPDPTTDPETLPSTGRALLVTVITEKQDPATKIWTPLPVAEIKPWSMALGKATLTDRDSNTWHVAELTEQAREKLTAHRAAYTVPGMLTPEQAAAELAAEKAEPTAPTKSGRGRKGSNAE